MKKLFFISLFASAFFMTGCGQKSTAGTESNADSITVENESTSENADPSIITSEQQFNEVVGAEGLTLVDFYATWCGPCKMMHPILEQLSIECANDVNVIKVDVDENSTLANKFNIQAIPALMLFKKGEIVWSQTGVLELEQLKEIIQKNK